MAVINADHMKKTQLRTQSRLFLTRKILYLRFATETPERASLALLTYAHIAELLQLRVQHVRALVRAHFRRRDRD